jgi:3'-5' exonuclease
MKRLVIDIETVGTPWEEHDQYVREYLIKGQSEAEAEEEKRRGGLSPFRGHIVAIGVINADDGRSCALYEVPGQSEVITRKEGTRTYISGSEKQILEKFWEYLGRDDRFITFNGRQFDGPFLLIRSAVNGVTPRRDLVGYRFSFHPNCDLREVLNFWGTLGRQAKFNLDFACKVFGITSSKTDSLDGRAVENLYRAGRYEEIANYCLDDVRATAELYEKLATTLLVFDREFQNSETRNPRVAAAETTPSMASDFIEALNSSSAELTSSLEREIEKEPPLVSSKQSAVILGKLMQQEEPTDDLVPQVPDPEA